MDNAIPTIFSVPNPPPRLSSTRCSPKRRKLHLNGSEATVCDEEAHSSSQFQPLCNLRSDHTYCAPSETECSSSDKEAVDCASSECVQSNTDTQTTSVDGTRVRRTVRRKIWSARECRLQKIIRR